MSECELLITTEWFYTNSSATDVAIVVLPFTAKINQFKRLYKALHSAGYTVLAISYNDVVLESGDPHHLISLVDKITTLAEKSATYYDETILIGGSLGGLIVTNVLRRSALIDHAVVITGGDIAKVVKKYFAIAWSQPVGEISEALQEVNMYSKPHDLTGKTLLMVVAKSDTVADPHDVLQEATLQRTAGNDVRIIVKPWFDHKVRVILDMIIFPSRVLNYVKEVKS